MLFLPHLMCHVDIMLCGSSALRLPVGSATQIPLRCLLQVPSVDCIDALCVIRLESKRESELWVCVCGGEFITREVGMELTHSPPCCGSYPKSSPLLLSCILKF